MAIIYGLKVNLSVAMVAMLNHTALAAAGAHSASHGETAKVADPNAEPVCQGSGNGTEVMEVRNSINLNFHKVNQHITT